MKQYPAIVALAGAALLVIVACTPVVSPSPSPGVTPPPSPGVTPSPPGVTPSPGGTDVTSAAQAAALVLASDVRFRSSAPLQPDLIGQCCWHEVFETPVGWLVTVTVGWGDCPSGCISRHAWRYQVERDGNIELVDEEGDEPIGVDLPGAGPAAVTIQLLAGPVCPVETNPPDPNCAPRPVVNAEVVVRSPDGTVLATALSSEQGQVVLELAEGAYYVEPQPVEGLMGTPEAVAFSVAGGHQSHITLGYDTGIR